MEMQEFQYPDGWCMRVGQIYSSPYESYHFKITKMIQDSDDIRDVKIYYQELDPRNYTNIINDEDEWSWVRSYWCNEGNWDLEKEPNTINLINGSTIKILPVENGTRGKRSKQSEYFVGIDWAKD